MTTGRSGDVALSRRQAVEEFGRYADLIASPHDFGDIEAGASSAGSLTMPGSVRLAGSVSASVSLGDLTINVGGRSYNCPAASADVVFDLGFVWRGEVMTVDRASGSPAADFQIYAVDWHGKYHLIAGTQLAGSPTAVTLSDNEVIQTAALDVVVGRLFTVGGVAPYAYSFVSQPDGYFDIQNGNELQVNASLSGLAPATSNFTIRTTDANSNTFDQALSVNIVADDANAGGDPGTGTVFENGFVISVSGEDTSGGLQLTGKARGTAKVIYDIGPVAADEIYTMRYTPDWSNLKKTGREAFVGFAFVDTNDFHFTGLQGDGAVSTTMLARDIRGVNVFDKKSGFTFGGGAAANNGTRDGPNWLQIQIGSTGTTYTLRTSADGNTWADEFTDALPIPLTDASASARFGIGVYLPSSDDGVFSVVIEFWSKTVDVSSLLAEAVGYYRADDAGNGIDTVPTPDDFTSWVDINSTAENLLPVTPDSARPDVGVDGDSKTYGSWNASSTKLQGNAGGIFTDLFQGGGTLMVVSNPINPLTDEGQGNIWGVGNVSALYPSDAGGGTMNVGFLIDYATTNLEGLTTAAVTSNAKHVFTFRCNTSDADPLATSKVTVDGTTEGEADYQFGADPAGAYQSQSAARFVLGNYENQGATSGGRFYAVIGWSRILTDSEVAGMEAFFNAEFTI